MRDRIRNGSCKTGVREWKRHDTSLDVSDASSEARVFSRPSSPGRPSLAQERDAYGAPGDAAPPASDAARDEYGDIRQTVARIAVVEGTASYARGDDPENWQPANPNVPLTIGDRLYAGARSRAELQIEGGNYARIGSATDLAVLNLTDDTKQFAVKSGVASFQIRSLDENDVFEIDTPNAAVTIERPGDYRVDVDANGGTRVSVREGAASVAAGGGSVSLGNGDAMRITGTDSPQYDVVPLAAADGWDLWVVRAPDGPRARVVGAVREPGRRRRGRPRRGRPLGHDPGIRTRLVADGRRRRMGSVSGRPLDLAGPVGMDLGLDGALGLGALPLRPLGDLFVALVLGPRRPAGAPRRLRARARRVRRRRPRRRRRSSSGAATSDGFLWRRAIPSSPGGDAAAPVSVTQVTYVNRTYVTVVNQTTFVSGAVVANNFVRDRVVAARDRDGTRRARFAGDRSDASSRSGSHRGRAPCAPWRPPRRS